VGAELVSKNSIEFQVFIISWRGQESNARHIETSLADVCDDVTVIHATLGAEPHTVPSHWIKLPVFGYGKVFAKTLDLSGGMTMMHIQSDVSASDWPLLLEKFKVASRSQPNMGLWSPLVHGTSWTLDRTRMDQRQKTGSSLHRVTTVDGIVWALGDPVVRRLKQFQFEENPLGWGIDIAAASICHSSGLGVFLDESVRVTHPRGSGYGHELAAAQAATFFGQLSETEMFFRLWIAAVAKERIAKEKKSLPYRLRKLGRRITRVLVDPIYRRVMR
jgi:hypothetical protein